MWYRVDLLRFAVQLVPPILRGGFLIALLKALVTPIRYLYDRFTTYRDEVAGRLDITAAVQYIEKALNDAFYLENGQIYIETVDPDGSQYWHLAAEELPVYMNEQGGTATLLRQEGEVGYEDNFIVWVPTFLCTSLDPAADKYGGEHLSTIQALLDYYRPAGRTYHIALYDYE